MNPVNEHSQATGAAAGPPARPPALVVALLTHSHSALIAASIPSRITYECGEEEVSSDDNEMTKVKVLMALADDESVVVGKESARNGKWVKIHMRKFIEPYKKREPIVTEADAPLDQSDQAVQSDQADQNDINDQNNHPVQTDEILNDDQPKHSNHNNDEHIIDNLTNTIDVHITKPPSYSTEDASAPNAVSTIKIVSPSSILSMAALASQDRWSRDKQMELVNIVGPDLNDKFVNETQYRGFDLKGYSDSDYVGCNMDRKITSGACSLLGCKIMCWSAKKHQYVAMSLVEAEYVVTVGCCTNILWMKNQPSDYDIDQPESLGTPISFDPAPQVDYNPDLINIKPNNEVELLYPDHANKDHFKVVFDVISKCFLQEAFIRTLTKYNEYLVKLWYTAKVLDKTNKVWLSTPPQGVSREK
nr:retrovirus-related Pol polyprotein from transposon TNT 1-94 [Tanacetum cinerariifolium]